MINNIVSIDDLIGKTVLSRTTGNKLGEVYDLYIDPVEGLLVGLTIQASDNVFSGLEYKGIHSFGKDAVMANDDDSVVPLKDGWLENHSHAKKHLKGIKIVTDGGNLLGQVANIFVRLTPPPVIIYEVRESVLDKLLGRNFFIYASNSSALSNNAERIVVPNDTLNSAASSLTNLVTPQANVPNQNEIVIDSNDNEKETIVRP
ncbi:MAG: PRC-barrel domain-containing protein [Acidobacteria bacterium]|jgi:uncharacterized protein YrrD|nr:PRC-barrel domain-containing protein [Acidobacteriota bacterium]